MATPIRMRAEAYSRRSSSGGVEQREGHIDHGLQVGDGDVLVGRVDVRHPVRQVDALEAAIVEDVGVGGASRELVRDGMAAALERRGGERDRAVGAPKR